MRFEERIVAGGGACLEFALVSQILTSYATILLPRGKMLVTTTRVLGNTLNCGLDVTVDVASQASDIICPHKERHEAWGLPKPISGL